MREIYYQTREIHTQTREIHNQTLKLSLRCASISRCCAIQNTPHRTLLPRGGAQATLNY